MAIESSSSTTTTVNRSTHAASAGLLLARLPLGAYFIGAAIQKFTMQGGVSAFVDKNLPDATKFMSEHLARTYLGALPYIELTFGTLIILGLLTRVAASMMSLLLVSFIVGKTGLSGHLSETVHLPFQPTLVFLGTALALMLCGPGWISLDGILFRPRRRIMVTEEVERGTSP